MSRASPVLKAKVKALLREGAGQQAIGEYRHATGCDLATARRAIEALAAETDEPMEDSSAATEVVVPTSPFPPAVDPPSSVQRRAPLAETPAPPMLRWQPVEAITPPPARSGGAHVQGFVAPPPRRSSRPDGGPRPRSVPSSAPAGNDLVVVFALALLVGASIAGGLVVAALLGR